MKITKEKLIQMIKEEVIDLGKYRDNKEATVQKSIKLEEEVAEIVASLYGGHQYIPVEVIEKMEELIDLVEGSL
tara:strand:+ start:82 stop:303 length:222 start_codon:yes stop_codon:yes gene_type:complete